MTEWLGAVPSNAQIPFVIPGNLANYITNPSGLGSISVITEFDWSVLNILNTPTGSEVDGDSILVGTAGTGDFLDHNNQIAEKVAGVWTFSTATIGDLLYNVANDTVYKYNGSTWDIVGKPSIHQGGDTFGAPIRIGTKDGFLFRIATNNTDRLRIASNGIFTFIPLTGAANGLMGLSTTGVASNVQIGSGLDLTDDVLSATGGGGGSSKFGKSGEDSISAENRSFNANSFNFSILNISALTLQTVTTSNIRSTLTSAYNFFQFLTENTSNGQYTYFKTNPTQLLGQAIDSVNGYSGTFASQPNGVMSVVSVTDEIEGLELSSTGLTSGLYAGIIFNGPYGDSTENASSTINKRAPDINLIAEDEIFGNYNYIRLNKIGLVEIQANSYDTESHAHLRLASNHISQSVSYFDDTVLASVSNIIDLSDINYAYPNIIIDSSSTIASLEIIFPRPIIGSGYILTIMSKTAITSLTLTPQIGPDSSGAPDVINGSITSMAANGFAQWQSVIIGPASPVEVITWFRRG